MRTHSNRPGVLRRTNRRALTAAGLWCSHCHNTGRVLLTSADPSGRFRTRTKPCPYHGPIR